ncbi:hypothetical protein SAMN05446635_5440 [Burkholderia sp. OK233]|nr:hypothetical protein SAMN05446635_5440 [Burkholderia sp. OK233]
MCGEIAQSSSHQEATFAAKPNAATLADHPYRVSGFVQYDLSALKPRKKTARTSRTESGGAETGGQFARQPRRCSVCGHVL